MYKELICTSSVISIVKTQSCEGVILQYRKEIDGLRAIAILPVIWVHSGLPFLTGGFLGVDVFFVISGFLITSILINEFENDKFSLYRFYERRARRILPALFAVIIATSIAVPFVSSHPKFISDYGISVLSTLLFSSNIYFWQTSGYFGSASELSPMLHTWSLAVEEQYYLFFPLFLIVLFPLGRKFIVGALLLVSIASLVLSEWGAANSPIGNFYLLPSRAWELLVGSLSAIYCSSNTINNIRSKLSSYLSLLGITLVFSSYFLFSSKTPHPTGLTIIPVLGTALILLFSHQNNVVGKALSFRFMTAIGIVSYSLYLWHQPILALMKKYYSLHLAPQQILLALTLTFLLSYLSWRYIETPFRNRTKFNANKIFKYSSISILVGCLCTLFFIENLKIQKRLVPEAIARFELLIEADKSHSNQTMYDDDECKFWSADFNDQFIQRFESCTNNYNGAIFILGGSHGMDLYNAVARNSSNPFVVSVSRGFCRAHKFIGNASKLPKCQYEDFKSFAERFSNNLGYVLYTQTPDRLFTTTSFDYARQEDLSQERVLEVTNYLAEIKTNYSLDVVMIGMLPPLRIPPINWNYDKPFDKQYNEIVSQNAIELSKFIDKAFATKLQLHQIPYISKIESFKLKLPDDLFIDGKITYSDNRHLSHKGEEIFGNRLVDYMVGNGYPAFRKNHN